MNQQRLQQVLAGVSGKSVAVVGDLMLDRFIYGRVSRISPEAPVPVVEVVRETSHPGGAANVARNLTPFCRVVFVCGRIGRDAGAAELRRLLDEEGVDSRLVLDSISHPTIVKTRVIARQQQVVRVDREHRDPLDSAVNETVLRRLESVAGQIDGVLIEDYGKGFLTQELVDGIASLFRGTKTILAVDPNPMNPLVWRGMTAVKPNRSEAFAAAGIPYSEPMDSPLEDVALLQAGEILLEKWGPAHLLITLGEHGMILFEPGQAPYHIPTIAREVFDVSGAGDTAIALFTAALMAGASAREAADISNHASGVVVAKLGTATLSPGELIASFE